MKSTARAREEINGFVILRAALSTSQQREMLDALRGVIAAAPLVRPITPWGKPMSVRMTSAGRLGWIIERGRYRYVARHPETGAPWPLIPDCILGIWHDISGWSSDPDCCLINWYGEAARMGLHRDADEGESAFAAPVVSISLGDDARFRMGGLGRRDPTRSTVLRSGDVVVMGGAARLAYHGVDRVDHRSGTLFPEGGRINLTLRVVNST